MTALGQRRPFHRSGLISLMALMLSLSAQALQITSLSPQGEVARVSQLVAKWDEAAVNWGDPKAPPPLSVSCNQANAARGSGRWTSDKEWVFDFDGDLPPGLRCTAQTVPSFKSPKGADISGKTRFSFSTGGPFVQDVQPYAGDTIDENQHFLLRLNGPAAPESVAANTWCVAEGLGERIPVQLIEGKERAALLQATGQTSSAAAAPLAYVSLQCKRKLSPGAKVQLVWGKGIRTPTTGGQAGVANTVERRFSFKVRDPFAASFACERENAQSGCLPIRPMRLNFNAGISRQQAKEIRLVSGKQTYLAKLNEGQADEAEISSVQFDAPFAEEADFTLDLPKGFADTSGRPLSNATSFPMKLRTGAQPPLAKFAANSFGVVERLAEPGPKPVALLPVTLRNVEHDLKAKSLQPGAKVADLAIKNDSDIIKWYLRVQAFNNTSNESRETPILDKSVSTQQLDLPPSPAAQSRPFEVVGIPLAPGFHVVEIASQRLGASLLDPKLGPQRTMYVRTSALVTNLGVHFKLGRENAAAWVTTLDKGHVVAGASVRVSDCRGKELAVAHTNAQGVAMLEGLSPEPPSCNDKDGNNASAYFVSARHQGADGVADLAFTWSDWNRGIEAWRFNAPTSRDPEPDLRAHTVLDRSLLRAGETVSMKHYLRSESRTGFGLPDVGPGTMIITHVGSGQQFKQALVWRKTGTGGFNAESEFQIPPAAKLGQYQIELKDVIAKRYTPSFSTAFFRVEEFRLPVLQGRVSPVQKTPLVKPGSIPTEVQVNYVAGGPATKLPVRVSALVRSKYVQFDDYDAFSFNPPRDAKRSSPNQDEEESSASQDQRVVADKLPLTLDPNGTGKVTIDKLPPKLLDKQPKELLLEATYADPNGEIQTLRSTHALWPAAVIAGIKTEGWVSSAQKIKFQALALDLAGKPQADVPLSVSAVARITTTSRKRMVGGFYTYDNKTELKNLGEVCSGKSDSRGLLLCESKLSEAGEVELVATAKDAQGNSIQAASSVWVTRQGELWFGGEDHDRMDLLPEKKAYQPGETAKLQVRMPFRFATALVAVEREGVLSTQVVQLNGQDPTVHLKIEEGWGPNVYVSVLALRGRLREVPWYSFFTWGFKAPREWWTSFWYEGREYVAPTALVDLSKPAFRLGMAELRVGTQAHQLDVKVAADKESYPVRGKAQVSISVTRPDGKPAAGAEVALAAVDQALLELMPNSSWNLLDAMLQRRAWGVETSTAQMEIIGRRHYGRKAVPAGGGGGRSSTRELLDTLLLWNPKVVLDAHGKASITVPLNDALTTFKIVAVADMGTGLFGTGSTSIKATQDLQIISGLPPLVREDDQFRAQFTLRNTTKAAMKVQVMPRATLMNSSAAPGRPKQASAPSGGSEANEVASVGAELFQQTIDIPAGEAKEVAWNVTAPAQLGKTRAEAILWEIEAKDSVSGARDALKARQRIIPAVPLTVQQATLVQLDGPFSLDVAPPTDAIAGRGGLHLSLQPKLANTGDGGMPAIHDWFANYPFACLEQKTSKAVGLRDAKLWQSMAAQLPTYLDRDGLVNYFPPRDGEASRGSDALTAYLLATTHEAASINPVFALTDEQRAPMERGLTAFVEGRIQRDLWSPRAGKGGDLDMRKIAALEALSRYGKAQARMLGSITIAPNQWPTHTVIDWLGILKRMPDVPDRDKRMAEATQILKSRLSYQGTKLIFSTERDDYWWWLMVNGDLNTARLMLTVMDDPAWKDDMGRLASGFIARQQRGTWLTTTANVWGGLALDKFSAKFESTPVSGVTKASLGSHSAQVDWAKADRKLFMPWHKDGAKETLSITQQGSGKPWLTVQSMAAVQLKAPFAAGYQISKTITPVEQATPGKYTRGDVLRISLEVTASADMTWVAITDPVPGGATILGGGLGRDSEIASSGEKRSGAGWPAFEERSFEAFRSYFDYLPKGKVKMEYTVRLNNVGDFALPPSRVEAMYAPEMFGEAPNARVKVEAGK